MLRLWKAIALNCSCSLKNTEFVICEVSASLFQGIREDLGIHHIVVNEWDRGVDADQNVVLISVPSVLSPDLAPPGKHVLHAYTPGTEPYTLWEGLDRRSSEYKNLKAERSEVFIIL